MNIYRKSLSTMAMLVWLAVLLCTDVQAFVPTPFEATRTVSIRAVSPSVTDDDSDFQTSSWTDTIHTARSGLSISPLITIAPITANLIEQRQECFNDQGIRVDCATWTGYYYTWGPPDNPYEGGPGEGGGEGESSGETTVVIAASAAKRLNSVWLQGLACCFGLLAVFFATVVPLN